MRIAAAGLVALAIAVAARAELRAGGIELVHNAPAETTLAMPGLRDPGTVWREMIDAARRTIDIEQFYVAGQDGEALDPVLRALEAAAGRGVRMRVLMERKGLAAATPATIERLRRMPGLQFRLIDYARVAGDGIVHAKFFVVDGRTAFVGSHNFDWRALSHIDETGLRIDDPTIAGQMQRVFDMDWAAEARLAAGRRIRLSAPRPCRATGEVYLVASPPGYLPAGVCGSEAELVRLIDAARSELRVQLMTYAPLDQRGAYYDVIDRAVRAAAQRGVRVKLLVADWNLTPAKLPYLRSLAVLPNVEVRYSAIPQARSGPIPFARVVHSKTMAIDGVAAWVGTSNWEGGYLTGSRDLEVVLRARPLVEKITALHERLWSSAYAHPLTATGVYAAPARN